MQDPLAHPPVDAATVVDAAPIVLIIPAELDNAALVRAVAGHLGARVGLTVTEITDLRLAVDEACALLIDGARNNEMQCQFTLEERGLRIVFCATGLPTRPDADGFGWLVLSTLVDELSWSSMAGGTRVDLLKCPVERDVS